MKNAQHIIVVKTMLIHNDGTLTEETYRTIDLYDDGARRWLAKHSWWALHNSRCVATYPLKQENRDGNQAAA